MAHNNTLISGLSESSNNVEVWAKRVRVQETITTHNLKERHLIVADPIVSYNLSLMFFFGGLLCKKFHFMIMVYWGCGIEITIPNNLIDKHCFGYFDEDQWRVFR